MDLEVGASWKSPALINKSSKNALFQLNASLCKSWPFALCLLLVWSINTLYFTWLCLVLTVLYIFRFSYRYCHTNVVLSTSIKYMGTKVKTKKYVMDFYQVSLFWLDCVNAISCNSGLHHNACSCTIGSLRDSFDIGHIIKFVAWHRPHNQGRCLT